MRAMLCLLSMYFGFQVEIRLFLISFIDSFVIYIYIYCLAIGMFIGHWSVEIL